MFDILDRAVTVRKTSLREQAKAARQRADAKDGQADLLEAARAAYRSDPCSEKKELELHRALLRSKHC